MFKKPAQPPGLTHCEVCGELKGKTEARNVIIEGNPAPDEIIEVSCVCDGVPCTLCKKNSGIRKPRSKYWVPKHKMVHIAHHRFRWAGPICPECHEKRNQDQLREPPQQKQKIPLKELMKLDDYERFEALNQDGDCLFEHYWTSDWPGYGSDVSQVFEYKGVYFSTLDSVSYGPRKTFEQALEDNGMFQVNSTTRDLCSSEFDTEEIAARCVANEAGLKVSINDEEFISTEKGKLEPVPYEENWDE